MKKIKSVFYKEIPVDFFEQDGEYYMISEDIGKCMGFKNPRQQIINQLQAHPELAEPDFSVIAKIEGKSRDPRFFNKNGIKALCELDPSRIKFLDWVVVAFGALENDLFITNVPVLEENRGFSLDPPSYKDLILPKREYSGLTDYECAKILLSAAALYRSDSEKKEKLIASAVKIAGGLKSEIDFECLL